MKSVYGRGPGFSWQRVVMTGRFYRPVLSRQMVWYAVVSLLLSLIACGCSFVEPLAPMGATALGAVSFMFYLAPLALTRYDDRAVATMLPATAAERWAFLMLYFFVAVPLLLLVPMAMIEVVALCATPGHALLQQFYSERLLGMSPSGIYACADLLPTVLCLWGVLHFRQVRVLKSLLLACGSLLLFGMIGGAYAIVAGFKAGYEAAMTGVEYTPEMGERIMQEAMTHFGPLLTVIGVLSLGGLVVMAWLCYVAIRKYQE
ncbi:MAG: hypothetical protein NC117_10445 [Pseudoflavonifractor sp.]|nr:hypothetical protein [Pseudoflavonifractor sp.]